MGDMMPNSLKEKLVSSITDETRETLRKFMPLMFFAGGFTWDSLTLTRVDNLLDNAILLGYLILLGLSIVLMYLSREGRLKGPGARFSGWYPNLIQFFMGGLFSSYVVFYFHSASMSRTLLFVLVLFALLVANEFLKDSLRNIYLTMGLYFFVSFAFFTFAIPVVLKKMSALTFMASGAVSMLLVSGMAFVLYKTMVLKRRQEMWTLVTQSALIFGALGALYWANWIPPVPLAVKMSGIYHNVERNNDKYLLTYEKPRWYQPWRKSDTGFRLREGDRVYCFSSIFAPGEFKKKVYHHWHQFDLKKNEWVQTDRVGFDITGGRGQGWRGYTFKQHIRPGRWRVDIRTEEGLMLGQIAFRVLEAPKGSVPVFVTESF